MTEGAGHAIDPSGEVRSVLRSAVADYGTRVLSNAAIIDGICEDRLPDWPREASLVSTAARADVAAMLQQQEGGVGADIAVRVTAANLAESRALDPAASIWVVSEFARALGYQVSDDIQPTTGVDDPSPVLDTSSDRPHDDDLTVLPKETPPHPPTEKAVIDSAETRTVGTGADTGTRPAGPRANRRALYAVGGAAALVVVYFIVAGAAHLPPFPTPTPTPTSTHHTPRPTASPTFTPTAGDRTLSGLIPADVSAGGSCSPVHRPQFGATAEMHCVGEPNIPTSFVEYYLFGSKSALNAAYATFMSHFAHVSRDSGRCSKKSGTAAFKSFSPCETAYSIGSSSTSAGRVMEYIYKDTPDISTTFTHDLVLVDMQGSNRSTLLKWWHSDSEHWLKT